MPRPATAAAASAVALSALKLALRLNRDDLVAIHELPGLRSLHQGLMGNEFAQ